MHERILRVIALGLASPRLSRIRFVHTMALQCRLFVTRYAQGPWAAVAIDFVDFVSVRVGNRRDPRIKVHIIEVSYTGVADWYTSIAAMCMSVSRTSLTSMSYCA